jgi:hypothetical protein
MLSLKGHDPVHNAHKGNLPSSEPQTQVELGLLSGRPESSMIRVGRVESQHGMTFLSRAGLF